MICTRCDTPMFRSSHSEEERIGEYVLVTVVVHIECPFCGVIHSTIVPGNKPEHLEVK